jgi:uncharacterized membrane protein YjgN (DUF898 family)
MKYNIQTTLTGRVWWKPFLLYILLSFALILPLELTLMRIDNPDNTIPLLPLFLFIAVLLALRVALEAVFTLILGRILVSSVSCNGIQPVLGGSTQEFVTLNLVCFVRTCITLGFYGPRYIKRHTDYLVEHCSIDGTGCSFSGTARSLFTYIYVGLVLPLIFWMMLFIAAAVAEQLVAESARVLPEVLMGVLGIGIFFLCIPFFYYVIRWYFNISWKEKTLEWNTEFWQSFFFLSGQLFLLLITLGIAWPVFAVRCWEYFAERTVIKEEGRIRYSGCFNGATGKAFLLFWGQALLCLITLGVYSPWAWAKCFNFMMNATSFTEIAHGAETLS